MKSKTEQAILNFASLGKEIKFSPKTKVTLNHPGYSKTYYVESVEVLIGIGNDHTATLIMSKDAWEALNQGEKLDITTLKQFKKNFL